MNNEKYILITQVGKQDPWSGWKNKSLEEVKHYGAVLRIIEKKSSLIKKVVLLISAEIKRDGCISIIEDEITKLNPDIEITKKFTDIEQAQDYEEIHPVLKRLLIKYSEDQEKYLINLSSGTPQINTYLHTLFLLGFWKSALKINVNDPNKDPEHKIIEYDTNKKEPIKEFFDASHIATLISRYDYSAALALATESGSWNKILDNIRSIKNCFSLDFNTKFQNTLNNLLPVCKAFIGNFPAEDLQKKALYYFSSQKKLELKEIQEAIIRFGVIREALAIDYLKDSSIKEFISKEENKYKIVFSELPIEIKNKYTQIGHKKFGEKFRMPSEKLELMADSACMLIETLKDQNDELVKILQKTKYIQDQRNSFAHSIVETSDFKSAQADLKALINAFLPEYKTIWEGENFFDIANRELLKKADLEWLLKERKTK